MAYMKIIEQPETRVRYRYSSERRSMGTIFGISATDTKRTYPTVELIDHDGPAWLVISCVTRDMPHHPHPHEVVQGEKFKNGICSFEIPMGERRLIVLRNLGIQCTKKYDVKKALEKRKKMRVNPFKTDMTPLLEHPDRIDLTCVRLCFQVFVEGKEPGSFTVPLQPVISEPIYDKKQATDLNIVFRSHAAGSAAGDTIMCVLAEKVVKDVVEVRFFDSTGWEAYARTSSPHYHKQVAIVFRTPPYKNQDLDAPVTVYMELVKTADRKMKGRSVEFLYRPLNPDERGPLQKKPQRVRESPRALLDRHLKAEKDATLIKLAEESHFKKILPQPPRQAQLNRENPILQKQMHQIQKMQKTKQHQLHQQQQQQQQQQQHKLQQQPQQPPQQKLQQQKQQQPYEQQQGINPMMDPLLQRQMQFLQQQHRAKFRAMPQTTNLY